MSWKIRLLATPPKYEDRQIGDAWFAEPSWIAAVSPDCCPYYHQFNSARPPLYVVLPSTANKLHGFPFLVDGCTWSGGKKGTSGWTVVGIPPDITVTPSINIEGVWHGYITNGEIGNDLDARK